ncbi:MAG: transposase [Bacilli bacterium]
MGVYSVPENIRKFKPKGTMVKVINGNKYYVYEYKSVTDEFGKRKTKMGKLIGKIIEGKGFVPNATNCIDNAVTTLEYGQYKVVVDNSKNTYKILLDIFGYDDAARIYSMAVINYVNGFSYLKDFKQYYEQSYLHLEFNGIKMGYTALSNLLDSLGRKQTRVHEFENKLIHESSKELAIDGHVIPNYSHENDLAENGNKFNKIGDSQLNVLMAYDINTNCPVSSRIYSGSTLDKMSIKDMLARNSFKNILFIVDRGFYSADNIALFSENENRYIIPLSSNYVIYKQVTASLNFTDAFVYERNKKRAAIDYKKQQIAGKYIYVFRDSVQNMMERTDYLSNLEQEKKGFTKEKFEEIKEYFGMIVLETNLDKSAKEIFELYKRRWKIETFYNFFKNKLNFEALNVNDYYTSQGLSFIMLIVGMIHSEISEAVKNIKGKSIDDILLESRFIKVHNLNGTWYVQNAKKELREHFELLNCALTKEIDFTYLKN